MRKTKTRSKSGIYKIINIVNNKKYIGSAVDPKARFYTHKSSLRKKRHHSIILQRAWDKYGEHCFSFEIIEECEKENLIKREQYYLDMMLPEYNVSKKANSCLGIKCSEESSRKKSLNNNRRGKFGKDNPDSMEIFQYTLTGIFLKKWYGMKEIERELGFNSANIGTASKNSDRTCYGFFWSRVFLGESTKPREHRCRKKCKKPVEMLDMNDNVLQTFDSQKEAADFLGLNSNGNINAVLRNKCKQSHGYKWRYKLHDQQN